MIKQSLTSLPSKVRQIVMFAFEEGVSHIESLDGDAFISVNCSAAELQKRGYRVLEEAGAFCYGRKEA